MRSPNTSCHQPYGSAFGQRAITLLLAFSLLCLFGTGCFVVRGERRLKPDAPGNVVYRSTDSHGYIVHYRHFDTPDFRLDVGVVNDADAKWELQFLFNIIPWYIHRVKQTNRPLITKLYLVPKSPGITFEPGRVLLLQTNRAPLPPSSIWLEGHSRATNTVDSLIITNPITLRFAFRDENQKYINQDLPFQLSVEGIHVCGQANTLPRFDFIPRIAIRPGFRLPY